MDAILPRGSGVLNPDDRNKFNLLGWEYMEYIGYSMKVTPTNEPNLFNEIISEIYYFLKNPINESSRDS